MTEYTLSQENRTKPVFEVTWIIDMMGRRQRGQFTTHSQWRHHMSAWAINQGGIQTIPSYMLLIVGMPQMIAGNTKKCLWCKICAIEQKEHRTVKCIQTRVATQLSYHSYRAWYGRLSQHPLCKSLVTLQVCSIGWFTQALMCECTSTFQVASNVISELSNTIIITLLWALV